MKTQYVIISIVMLAIVAALSVPASAFYWPNGLPLSDYPYCNADPECNCTVWENIVIANGSYDIDLNSSPAIIPEDYNYTFTVPWYDNLMYAGVYQDVWTAGSCGPMEFTYNGIFLGRLYFGTSGSGCGHDPCDNNSNVACCGLGGCGVWWNVTAYTNPGQINWYYKNDVSYGGCSFDARDRGCSLITWGQNDTTDDTLYLWFNQGREGNPVADIHIYNVTKSLADEWTLCLCMISGDNGDYIEFNDNRLDWSAPNHWMDVNCYNVTAYVNTLGTTNTIEWFSTDEYFYPYWTLLVGRKDEKPDLLVTDIEFPVVMQPDINQQVNATIRNQGGATTGVAFNVSLEVDGTPYDKVEDVGPLAAGSNTTVHFTVNLPGCCHNFTVVADCDNDVNESNENNNTRTEYYKVGIVIAVENNSGFDDLVEKGICKKEGNTYICENLTITNCAGAGITIANTNVPFVFKNCTVYNCLTDGVYFYNLTNGTIEDCTVRDNSGKGIRVSGCTYVDIKDNDIFNNTGYGIEVCPRPQQVSDCCKFVNITNNNASDNFYGIELIGYNCTVKHNTVQNNSQYGIYVHGKYNVISYNDIKYNEDYGLKMYNCTDNCIFWNNFIDNNLQSGTPQGYDNTGNYWNTTIEICYYYPPGTCHENRTGNYWSEYVGSDPDGDGIGNIPYPISGGTVYDYYPLMYPWQNYALVTCGDVDCNGAPVAPTDVTNVENLVRDGTPLTCLWAADTDCSGAPVAPTDVTNVENLVRDGTPLACCQGCL